MSKISIKLKNLSHALLVARGNLVLLFYVGLVVLLGFEFFVAQKAVRQGLESMKSQPPSHSVQKVRINFTDYEANLKRLESSKDFNADLVPEQNPFRSQ